MSTKSFIISLPIITGGQDRRRLRKSFSFGCNLQNAVMGGGWDRVLKMRATAEWQTARAMPKSSERTKAFRDLRVRFRLSEYDFHADVAKHRKASGRGHLLGINECQKLASRAWISVERHLYNGGSPRFISSRRGLHSIEGKTNRTGIIWKADQQCVTVCKHVYRVRVDKRDDWLTRALQDPTDPKKPRKVKYCRIVREMRKGKERFFLQLVAEGTSPLKHAYAGKDLHVAIDPGLGSLTYATEDGTIAKVQIAPSADTDRRAIRRIQRAMERSRRTTNPDNYEAVDVLSLPEAVAHLSVPVEEAACIDSILVSLRISFRSLDIDDEFRSEIENLLKTGIAVGITIGHHENLPDPVLRRHLIQEQAQGFGLTRFPVKQIVIDGNAGLIDQDGHGHLNLIVLVVPVGVERAQRVGVPCIEPAGRHDTGCRVHGAVKMLLHLAIQVGQKLLLMRQQLVEGAEVMAELKAGSTVKKGVVLVPLRQSGVGHETAGDGHVENRLRQVMTRFACLLEILQFSGQIQLVPDLTVQDGADHHRMLSAFVSSLISI